MIEPNDWRLRGQERYLTGAELCFREYRQYPENPPWDHDHCSFCWAKFSFSATGDDLREGYCTPDETYWICGDC